MTERHIAWGLARPSLSAVATLIAQTERTYLCPEGVIHVLCAANGGCDLITGEHTVGLIGARMAFVLGPLEYRLANAAEDCTLTQLDIALTPGGFLGFGLGELEHAFPAIGRMLKEPGTCHVFYDNFAFVSATLENIHAFTRYDTPDKGSQIALSLCFLLSAMATSSWDEDVKGKHYSKHVRDAIRFIHENYMCSITTTDIAEAAHVHIGHLHRIFPAETGCRVGEYLTDLRIRKAKMLLIRTDISTNVIASRIGVTTAQYFSRLFKQKVGVTPQAFRKSYNFTSDYGEERAFYCIEEEPVGKESVDK